MSEEPKVTLAEARRRHELYCEQLGLPDEDREEAWLLAVEVYSIQYPPGPTAEQELKMIKLGRLVQAALR